MSDFILYNSYVILPLSLRCIDFIYEVYDFTYLNAVWSDLFRRNKWSEKVVVWAYFGVRAEGQWTAATVKLHVYYQSLDHCFDLCTKICQTLCTWSLSDLDRRNYNVSRIFDISLPWLPIFWYAVSSRKLSFNVCCWQIVKVGRLNVPFHL